MNTLAKVFRNESAASLLPFRPDELGSNTPNSLHSSQASRASLAGGSLAFQFPVIDTSAIHAPVARVINTGHGTHAHIFPEVDELPPESLLHENENSALERAIHEKTLQEARAALEAEMNESIGSLREDLAATIDRVSGLADEIASKLEIEVVELALEIAKKIVAREVSIEKEVVLSVAKNALSKLHSRTLASIHLHPEDLSYVQEHRNKLNFHGSLELVEDGSVTPGGCLIHTDCQNHIAVFCSRGAV